MGTDMHNIGNRMPDTKEAMSWMRTAFRQYLPQTDNKRECTSHYRKQNNKIKGSKDGKYA